jgi:hypothetical protein
MTKKAVKKQLPKNAFNAMMDYTIDHSFKLVKNILGNKWFEKSKTSPCIFLMQVIEVCINRLFYDGYNTNTVKDMLNICMKRQLEFIEKQAKEDAKNFKL